MTMTSSMRQRAALATVVAILLAAALVGLWFADRSFAWKKAENACAKARRDLAGRRSLVAQRARWNDEYEAARAAMPAFPEGESVDTYWMNKVFELAETNHVFIAKYQVGAEQQVGDVYELPIEVRDWEAGLEQLVRFLYDLEHAEGAMFDIGQMTLKPSPRRGFLRGTFTLVCAYMRDEKEEK